LWSEARHIDRHGSGARGLRAALIATLLLALAAPLGACGFRPLYGSTGVETNTLGDLSSVAIVAPETTVGRTLKFNLLDTLNTDGDQPVSPLYKLNLRPYSYSQNVAIQQDASVTRANFVLVVPFTLVSTATGKTLFKSTARRRTSYNRVESEFANISASQDAEKRTTEAVAADIKLQLSVYFDRHPGGKTAGDKTSAVDLVPARGQMAIE
jgi:LPS-assembly lipoprotein